MRRVKYSDADMPSDSAKRLTASSLDGGRWALMFPTFFSLRLVDGWATLGGLVVGGAIGRADDGPGHVGAQVFAGGLGGSAGSARRDFDGSTDTLVTLSWKIGAGGLFDGARQDGARSRLRQAELSRAKASDEIVRQVVEAHAGIHYLAEQVKIAEEAVRNAEQGYRLSLERKELAVGVVLETLQSQQDLIQSRLDYAQTVGEWNKAHYRLKAAIGE